MWNVAILGGGITGLAAAYELERRASGEPVSWCLVEGGSRWGGKVLSERHDGFRLSYVAVPTPVSLEAPAAAPFLDLLVEATGETAQIERRRPLEDPDPPDGPRRPKAATERLLL